jgi:hypothetical protein
MQENHRLPMGTNLRLLIQTPYFILLTGLHGLVNIVNFNANVVHATVLILVQKGLNGTLLAQGMQQLDLGIAQVNEHCINSVL